MSACYAEFLDMRTPITADAIFALLALGVNEAQAHRAAQAAKEKT